MVVFLYLNNWVQTKCVLVTCIASSMCIQYGITLFIEGLVFESKESTNAWIIHV